MLMFLHCTASSRKPLMKSPVAQGKESYGHTSTRLVVDVKGAHSPSILTAKRWAETWCHTVAGLSVDGNPRRSS